MFCRIKSRNDQKKNPQSLPFYLKVLLFSSPPHSPHPDSSSSVQKSSQRAATQLVRRSDALASGVVHVGRGENGIINNNTYINHTGEWRRNCHVVMWRGKLRESGGRERERDFLILLETSIFYFPFFKIFFQSLELFTLASSAVYTSTNCRSCCWT